MERSRVLLQKNGTFSRSFTFFAKEHCVLCILLRSLCSLTFLRKERKRTHHSFGSHKSPKNRKKNIKERCILKKNSKEPVCSERKRTRCPTLDYSKTLGYKNKFVSRYSIFFFFSLHH